jgi:predicted nucleic acid-binding protein
MNGNKLLLDTNILIYLSKKDIELQDIADSGDIIAISVITYMEALGYPFTSNQEEEIMVAVCENLNVVQLDDEIISTVILLRKTKKIKLPDAIILATAAVRNMVLITHNTSDFENNTELVKIVDPFIQKS